MNDEQWQDTVTRIEDTFTVLRHEVVRGDEISGDTEVIEFQTPQGKMKLERISKPRVIGKSALASKRIGGSAAVKYEYSATERIHSMTAFRWDEAGQEWKTIEMKGGFGHAA